LASQTVDSVSGQERLILKLYQWLLAVTTVALAGLSARAVYGHGWISDDAFITFRYVSNLLDGHGPVFNVGERVQGYTHPLWFLFLVPLHAVFTDPIYLVVGLGVVLTVLTIVLAAYGIVREARSPLLASAGVLIFAVILLSSESWLSFQTGGLENPLSHLLIVALAVEVLREGSARPFPLGLLSSLIFLTRPDFLPLVAPLAIVQVAWSRSDKSSLGQFAAGLLPILFWEGFSLAYYDSLIPNTAAAKVGILGSWQESVEQGWAYLKDWLHFEPLPAFSSLTLLATGFALARRPQEYAFGLGVLLYLLYVIYIGGDFMRGRFLLVFLVAGSFFGVLLLMRGAVERTTSVPVYLATASVVAASLVLNFTREPLNAQMSSAGIIYEREFYTGFHLSEYRKRGYIDYFVDVNLMKAMTAYAENCGSLTIHIGNVGTLGYYVGPGVKVIDNHGLTDSFIAHLPNTELVSRPRVGHPFKYIPVSYLAQKGDISLFRGWEEAVRNGDCKFQEKLKPYLTSGAKINPFGEFLP
jgi:arabinofuranosyltransferase